jgi:hypothetical protein
MISYLNLAHGPHLARGPAHFGRWPSQAELIWPGPALDRPTSAVGRQASQERPQRSCSRCQWLVALSASGLGMSARAPKVAAALRPAAARPYLA